SSGLYGQNFSAGVSQNPVKAGDRFTLSFTLENTSGKITPPKLTDFLVIFGPSQSSNFSYINGRSSRTITVSYVLLAEEPGTYTIGSATAETDDGKFTSDPIKITVTEGNTNSGNSASNQQSSSNAAPVQSNTDASGNVIIQVVPSRTEVYIGEPIELSYNLLSRYSQLELGETTYPSISGFWTENIDLGNVQWDSRYVTINGMRYRRATIKKQLIYPQRSGKLTIPSYTQNVVVNRSFFNPGTNVSAESNTVNIQVKPYPGNPPTDFANITGLLKMSTEISAQEVNVNEAITFKLKVSGEGNLKLLNPPQVNFPGDFEVYEPKTNDRIAVTANGIRGSREWEYIIIPRYPGDYEIPEITMSYFNQASKSYQTLRTNKIDLKIGGTASGAAGAISVNPKSDVTLLNKDIRFIETRWDQAGKNDFYAGKWLYWIIALVMAALGLLLTYIKRKQQSLAGNVVAYKQKKASKLAMKHLSKARGYLKEQKSKEFYLSVIEAIHGFIQDKFSVDKTALVREELKRLLLSKGATEEQFAELQQLIDDCDMARYAPSAEVDMKSTFERAKKVLQWLEKLS
ncbi:MAG: BatD family protein, partial [Luteibaculum sp.]